MAAALCGKCNMVEYFLSLPDCQREDKIDALELLGTSFLFKANSDHSKAYLYFKKAMQERYKPSYEIIKKQFVAMTTIIIGTAECQTFNDLDEIENDELSMCMEAVAIQERLLGTKHRKVLKAMFAIGKMFADLDIHDKCCDMWLFALHCHQSADKQFEVGRFPELFADMFYNRKGIIFSRLLEVFEGAVTELIYEENRIQKNKSNIKTTENYDKDILVCLYLIGMMLLANTTAKENEQLHQAVSKFVKQKPRLQSGSTPLHMCCDRGTNQNKINVKNIIKFPHTIICKTLLTCGADVNAQDKNKQTPLYVIAKTGDSIVHIRKISKCLIEHGAHVDACTNDGESVIDVATKNSAVDIIKAHIDLRLACLAARVVMKHRLKYQNVIPATLAKFVELH